MGYRHILISTAIMIFCSLLLFRYYEQEMTRMWMDLAIHPDIQELLHASGEDQKELARLQSEERELYRTRFEEIQKIRQNLFIINENRASLQSHYRYALWGLFALIVAIAVVVHWTSRRRLQVRIHSLSEPIEALASGKADVVVAGPRKDDAIGRISDMIEDASRLMGKQRSQLEYLEHLSHWQEAARRSAHEIRTPLTAARMELERLQDLTLPEEQRQEVFAISDSIIEELDRLKRFTQEFTSFGKVRKPSPEPCDLGRWLGEFVSLFSGGWENLTLVYEPPEVVSRVSIDREMIRQVLVNLCNNASAALGVAQGQVCIDLILDHHRYFIDLKDSGPGVAPEMIDRIFQPYATTKKVGEGMGLGLAISRKIMLDHGGELELLESSDAGTTFRLILNAERSDDGDMDC